ncbi:Serine/threonine-protein kinase haspin [Chytriomyces hyalinus]|nr:Serine/threonine-protein kinase haspin [Chytriomyces hyalinus]
MLSGSQHSRVKTTYKRRPKTDFASTVPDTDARKEEQELAQVIEPVKTAKLQSRRETPRTRIESSSSDSESSDELNKLLNAGSRKSAKPKQAAKEIRRRPTARDPIPKESTLQPRKVSLMTARSSSKTSSALNALKSSRAAKANKATSSSSSSSNWDTEKTYIDRLEDKPLPAQILEDDLGEESFHVVEVNNQSSQVVRQLMGSSRDSRSVAQRRNRGESKRNENKPPIPWMVKTSNEKSTDNSRASSRRTSPKRNDILGELLDDFAPRGHPISGETSTPRFITTTPRISNTVAELSNPNPQSKSLQAQIADRDDLISSFSTSPAAVPEPTAVAETDDMESDFEVHFSREVSLLDLQKDEHGAIESSTKNLVNITSAISSLDLASKNDGHGDRSSNEVTSSALKEEERMEHVQKSVSIVNAPHEVAFDHQYQEPKSAEKNPFVKSDHLDASILSGIFSDVQSDDELSRIHGLENAVAEDSLRIQTPSRPNRTIDEMEPEASTQAEDSPTTRFKFSKDPTKTTVRESFHMNSLLENYLDAESLHLKAAGTVERLPSSVSFEVNDYLGDDLLHAHNGSQMILEDGLAVDHADAQSTSISGENFCHTSLILDATGHDEEIVNPAITPSSVEQDTENIGFTALISESNEEGCSSSVQNMSNSNGGILAAEECTSSETILLPELSLEIESESQMHHQEQSNELESDESRSVLLDTRKSIISVEIEAINIESAYKSDSVKESENELSDVPAVEGQLHRSSSVSENNGKGHDSVHDTENIQKPTGSPKQITKIPSVTDSGLTLDAEFSLLDLTDQPQKLTKKPPFGVRSENLFTLETLLAVCKQSKPISFESALSNYILERKIGEATFSEVYSFILRNADERRLAVKVIPFGAPQNRHMVNGSHQVTAHDIAQEVLVTKTLGEFEKKTTGHLNDSVGASFVELVGAHVCQGYYSEALLDAWDEYDDAKDSENDRPDYFPKKQLYVVIVLENAGTDLEHFKIKPIAPPASPSTPMGKSFGVQGANNSASNKTWALVRSILMQTILAIAAAERQVHFEHRDLHWGNVMCMARPEFVTARKRFFYGDDGKWIDVALEGVKVIIIDYTLSRCQSNEESLLYNKMDDEEIFEGEGDYQFDIYRMMKEEVQGKWESFCPRTNLMWFNYLVHKMVKAKSLPTAGALAKKNRKLLTDFQKRLLDYRDTSEMVSAEFLRGSAEDNFFYSLN